MGQVQVYMVVLAVLAALVVVLFTGNSSRSTGAFDEPDETEHNTDGKPSSEELLAQEVMAQRGAIGKIEVYQDRAQEYRWRAIAPNGQIVATGHEGYKTQLGCLNGLGAAGLVFGSTETPPINFV